MTQDQTEQKKQRRRGILKAAAGVPALLTLPTGAALAATSFTCIDKGKNLQTPAGFTTQTDTWVRYRVARQRFRTSTSGNSRVNGFQLDNEWYQVLNGSISLVTLSSSPGIQAVNSNPLNYYLLVDSQDYTDTATKKNFVFLGDANIGQPVAGASCWNSVIVKANVKNASSPTNLIN